MSFSKAATRANPSLMRFCEENLTPDRFKLKGVATCSFTATRALCLVANRNTFPTLTTLIPAQLRLSFDLPRGGHATLP
jgi:hypothetical protein